MCERRVFMLLLAVCLFFSLSLVAQAQVKRCASHVLQHKEQAFTELHEKRQANAAILPRTESQYQALALDYISYSQACYEHKMAMTQAGGVVYIDDGGMFLPGDSNEPGGGSLSTETGKWGAFSLGAAGGVVTYSFMNVQSSIYEADELHSEPQISRLNGYQPCFVADIVAAFAAWSAVANIDFRQVVDDGTRSDVTKPRSFIRIGAHAIPPSTNGVRPLAHAYYPTNDPTITGIRGDIHYNSDYDWSCDASKWDVGIVAVHEIGHSIGLEHIDLSVANAVMNPFYSINNHFLKTNDVNRAIRLYGERPRKPITEGAKSISAIIMFLLEDVFED